MLKMSCLLGILVSGMPPWEAGRTVEDALPCMRFQMAGDTRSKGIERFQPSSSISHTT